MSTTCKVPAAVSEPLWAKYQQTRSVEDRNKLIVLYFGQLEVIAAQMLPKLRDGVNIDDLISSGSLGLIQAVETFEPARNFKFLTFAGPRIRGAILDGLREIDHASRTDRTIFKKYERATETFYAQHGRKPTSDELQSIMPLDEVQSAKLKRALVGVPTASSLADQIYQTDNGKASTIADSLVDERQEAPSARAERQDFIRVLLSRLPVRLSLFVSYYFLGGFTMRQIGEHMGLSESRTSQMITAALELARVNPEVA